MPGRIQNFSFIKFWLRHFVGSDVVTLHWIKLTQMRLYRIVYVCTQRDQYKIMSPALTSTFRMIQRVKGELDAGHRQIGDGQLLKEVFK